jgi:hypothetical protein
MNSIGVGRGEKLSSAEILRFEPKGVMVMKLRTLLCGFACGALTMLLTAQVSSMDDEQVRMSDNELREAVKQAARPSDGHKKLKRIRGRYNHAVKFWRSATSAPLEVSGMASTDWMLDGRFMRQDIKGTWMNLPFEAVLILGYDNSREEYTAVWMDSLGTDMLISKGKLDPSGEMIVAHGEYVEITSGQPVKVKSTYVLPSRDKDQKFEMYKIGPEGQEFKFIDVEITRRIERGA